MRACSQEQAGGVGLHAVERELLPLHVCVSTTKGKDLCTCKCSVYLHTKSLHEGMCVCAHCELGRGRVCFQLHGVHRKDLWGKLHEQEHSSRSCQPFVACWSNVVFEGGSLISWDKPHTSRVCIQPGREWKWDKRTVQVSLRCHCAHTECNDSVPLEAMGWEERASFLESASEIEIGQSKHASTWSHSPHAFPKVRDPLTRLQMEKVFKTTRTEKCEEKY